jgi:hypothetical protein
MPSYDILARGPDIARFQRETNADLIGMFSADKEGWKPPQLKADSLEGPGTAAVRQAMATYMGVNDPAKRDAALALLKETLTSIQQEYPDAFTSGGHQPRQSASVRTTGVVVPPSVTTTQAPPPSTVIIPPSVVI